MRKFTFPGRLLTGLLLLLMLLLTGCGGGEPAAPTIQHNPLITLTAPEGPTGQTLQVTLTDKEGTAIIDAQVGLEGNMNHAGMVPVLADPMADETDGNVDGIYQIPFAFTMRGDWIVTVSVNLADGTTFTQDFDLSVTADTVDVK